MKKIAIIVKGYPRLSETFIAQEILALERAGIDVIIYSLRHPTDKAAHPIIKKINAPVYYLPEYLYRHPLRLLLALTHALTKIQFYKLLLLFLNDLRRDLSVNRGRRFGQALVLAREIQPDREWLYAHFLHTPASVTRYASHLTGLRWSCSAHAKDIWTTPKWELKEKMAELEWLVTCTASNLGYLNNLKPKKTTLLYHGLDLSRFPAPLKKRNTNGSNDENTVNLLSVGRAVNKKGYDIVLNALSKLPKELNWRLTHIGGGPLLDKLAAQALHLKINHRLTWLGALSFESVLKHYQESDMFVLASRIDKNGDRDGLPNVLMEAMTQELACIATTISGIPELIENKVNGILVPPEDDKSLADAIERLIKSPQLRANLGAMAIDTIYQRFELDANIQKLVEKFK